MKAAVWHGYKDIRIDEVMEPAVKPGHVKIKVGWAGICGTDRHEYTGPNFIPATKPHRLTGRLAPLTMGHEFSGIISEVGPGVENWKIGDRVTASGTLACGECAMCKSGHENICSKLGFLGISDDGAFAEYVLVDEKMLFKIPDNVGMQEAVLCEPLACGQHAVNLMGRDFTGKNVLVSGSGIIGLSSAIACIQANANLVIVSGVGTSKKQFVEEIGAHYVDVMNEDVIETVKNLTQGGMMDAAFECVGIVSSLNTVIQSTRPGSSVMVMGVFEKPPTFPMNDFQEGERVMYTSQAHLHEIGDCLEKLSQGKYPYISQMITGRADLEKIVDDGFEELNRNKDGHIKLLIRVAGDDLHL